MSSEIDPPRTTASMFPVGRLLIDMVLTGGFWLFMFFVLHAHVPSDNPFWINLWSAITAGCLSLVFFMGLQMFRLVLHDPEK